MKQWTSQHIQALGLVIGRMGRTRLATLMMLCVIGVTLSLPAGLYLILDNIGKLASGIDRAPQISLFLSLDATRQTAGEMERKLRDHPQIKDFRFVGRDEAWAELRQKAGLEDIASGLEKNPLPDAYVIHSRSNDPAAVEQLQHELSQWPKVEHAQLDAAWVKRLYSLMQIGQQAVLILATLLGVALLAVIGNTIRLQILTQREEIEVSQLIGATDAFVRRPFLYAGALHGIGGGIAAWLLLAAAVSLFNRSIDELASLYASDFRLQMLDADASLLLILAAGALGWAGSHLAVSRYLSHIKSS